MRWHTLSRRPCSLVVGTCLAALLGGCGAPAAPSPSARAAAGRLLGDLNGNNAIDAADATKILRVVVGLDAPPVDLATMDFNANGQVDAADATKVLRVVVGLDAALGVTARTVDVAAETMTFAPADVTVNPGDTVRWTNQSSLPHTVTADSAGGPLSPGTLAPGGQYSFAVPANTPHGTTWFYHCAFHGSAGNGSAPGQGMVGALHVN